MSASVGTGFQGFRDKPTSIVQYDWHGGRNLRLFIPNAQCMDYYTYIWVVLLGVNVGKYIIHRVFGYGTENPTPTSTPDTPDTPHHTLAFTQRGSGPLKKH